MRDVQTIAMMATVVLQCEYLMIKTLEEYEHMNKDFRLHSADEKASMPKVALPKSVSIEKQLYNVFKNTTMSPAKKHGLHKIQSLGNLQLSKQKLKRKELG